MSERDKTLLIVILALVSLCGCFVVSCCAAGFYMVSRADRNTIQEILSNNSINNISETGHDKTDTALEENDPDTLSDAEQTIINETEKTRKLSSPEKLAPIYLSEDDIRKKLIDQLDEVSDKELADELALYNLLGFAPKDFDLRQFYVDLYSEQIAGFYDPDDNQMYLIKSYSPYKNAMTLSHEYTHYLQYNNPDFNKLLQRDDDFCEENGETCMIIDALIEGDASLTENLIDTDAVLNQYRINSDTASPSSNDVFLKAPKFFQDSLLFPYTYGFDFVSYHYLKGGYDAVNNLYIDPPQSIEQIMHPEKYLKDSPVETAIDPFRTIISDKFEIIREDVLNEADIKMIFSCGYNEDWQLSDRQANTGAEGWGGGSFIFAENEGNYLLFSKLIWDTENDAKEAESLFALYGDKRFGAHDAENTWVTDDNSTVRLIRQDDILYWMILPDNFEKDALIDLIQNGSIL